MLRKILMVSLVALTFASCKKDKDDAPSYHVSAKVNGEKKDFTGAVTAIKQSILGYNVVMITGLAGTSSSAYPAFTLAISDEEAIKAGTYKADPDYDATATYTKSGSESYESDTDFTITISSITDTEVKGSFSGKIEDGATVMTVAEGTFSAKFQ